MQKKTKEKIQHEKMLMELCKYVLLVVCQKCKIMFLFQFIRISLYVHEIRNIIKSLPIREHRLRAMRLELRRFFPMSVPSVGFVDNFIVSF